MITEKDIQSRVGEILTENGFDVVANEVNEGFAKPAVFVTVYPSSTKLLSCGGATEEVTDSVEIQYIPAVETIEDCIETADKIKRIFLYSPFNIQDRHLTIAEIEFDIEKTVLYVYFEISFIQVVDRDTKTEGMKEIVLTERVN